MKKQLLLKKAADLIGHHELALRLNVSDALLEAWIKGDATMPDGMLMVLSNALGKHAEAKPPIRR